MNEQKFPKGWDAERVKRLIADFESMTEDEQIAADEAAAAAGDAIRSSRRQPSGEIAVDEAAAAAGGNRAVISAPDKVQWQVYEQGVADFVAKELAAGKLALDPKQAVMKRRPSYYSRDREKNIQFDMSVEVRLPGATEPFWVWIWECKHYSHTVPVDDVEEFHAKLIQVGANRTKGTILTPIGFDSGALAFARSKGIGLWRWIPDGSILRLVEDKNDADPNDIVSGLITPNTREFRHYGLEYCLTTDGRLLLTKDELIRAELTDIA